MANPPWQELWLPPVPRCYGWIRRLDKHLIKPTYNIAIGLYLQLKTADRARIMGHPKTYIISRSRPDFLSWFDRSLSTASTSCTGSTSPPPAFCSSPSTRLTFRHKTTSDDFFFGSTRPIWRLARWIAYCTLEHLFQYIHAVWNYDRYINSQFIIKKKCVSLVSSVIFYERSVISNCFVCTLCQLFQCRFWLHARKKK